MHFRTVILTLGIVDIGLGNSSENSCLVRFVYRTGSSTPAHSACVILPAISSCDKNVSRS